jgi:large subunit ribosomal protein L13
MATKFKTRTTSESEIVEKWYQIDATGKRIGLLATKIAEMLLDKGNPKMRDYLTPKVKVVIVNADQLDISDKKKISKLYTQYSGYPGGLKTFTLGEVYEKFPERVLEKAIKRMLPKNRRGRAIYTNLYVYAGTEHKHQPQKPEIVDIEEIKY